MKDIEYCRSSYRCCSHGLSDNGGSLKCLCVSCMRIIVLLSIFGLAASAAFADDTAKLAALLAEASVRVGECWRFPVVWRAFHRIRLNAAGLAAAPYRTDSTPVPGQ
jgi:hypothetical protein